MTGSGRPGTAGVTAVLLALVVLATSALGVTVAAVSAAPPLPAGCGPAGTAQHLAGVTLDAEQLANAQLIVATTSRTRMPAAAAVIAVMAAQTESGLRNLPGGDRDSAGLFQIRTGLHGTDVATDPDASTRWFLAALASLPNWQQLTPAEAAAAVERPAAIYRTRYSGALNLATAVVARFWPTATAAVALDLAAPVPDESGNTRAGQAGVGPDSDLGLPLCPTGGPGTGGAPGAATASIPCTTGISAGTVVAGPGGVPIRICTVGPWQVDTTIASRIAAMLAASRAAGLDLGGGSYRSTQSQVALRRAHCGPTVYDLYSRPAGQCSPPTARPGRSMHAWGRALDITDHGQLLRSHNDPAFRWLAAHAASYGLANLPSEPWHWSTNGH